MNTSLIVNVVLLFVAGFIGLTFLRAMYPVWESLMIQREKTRIKMEAMRDPNWVDLPPSAKPKFNIRDWLIKYIKKGKKEELE